MCLTFRKRTACLLILLLSLSFNIFGQHQLFLKNRVVTLPEGIPAEIALRNGRQQRISEGKSLVIIQFHKIPDVDEQSYLKNSGIELLDYVPDNAYTATVVVELDREALIRAGVRAVYRPGIEDIVEPMLLSGIVPDHVRKVAGKFDVAVSFARSFTVDDVLQDINQSGFEILSEDLISNQVLEVRIPEASLRQLARFPWVQYIEPVTGPMEMLNDKSAASTKANVLGSNAISGYKLTGEGVVIGVGDDSNPMIHPDIGRRVISYVPISNSWHGVHVGGTIAGSGLLNEKYKGYAPSSKLVVRSRSQIWTSSSRLVREFGMVVTSNTYGGSSSCLGFGGYSYAASELDQQAFDFPHLLHVFASGNSGLAENCMDLPKGFGNVLGDYQSAKNVLTVGRTQTNAVISPSSSKGPTQDGRIKPEVTAPGTSIYSTMPDHSYQAASGTSMATPAVTGGAALLYQRYRQLHQQNNPENALIKALICNGATDLGLPGPDYSYGFGLMNLLRSATMLDKGHYVKGVVTHQANRTHEIVVPSNTARLKVLIYWNDPAPAALAGGGTLVNNLDLSLIRPGNAKVLPKFPSRETPAIAAVAGVDSINNIEQIVLDEPAAGTYTVQVEATKIPQGVQEYFLVYDIIETSLTVTYPLAEDHLTKGDQVNICWDSYGDELSTFNLAYSVDNGGVWTTLKADVAANQRQFSWTVPDAVTGHAKVRVIRNGGGVTNISGPFTILGVPEVILQPVQCEGYIAIQWNAINGASDYEVMVSTGDDMRTVAVTTGLKYTLAALSMDSTYYVSVRARKDQVPGRRSVALIRKPDSGTCQGAISDNDLKMEAVVTPLPNVRMLTNAAYLAEHAITIRIKNLDDEPQAGPFEVGYSLGGAMYWESVNITLPPTASTDYTFERRVNLASVSEAALLVRVRLAGDPVKTNDSLVVRLRQIPNPKLVLPYIQNVESIPALDIRASTSGIQGAEAYDFAIMEGNGRLRTAVRPVVGYLSQSSFVIDASGNTSEPSQSFLEGTYNLSDYRVQNDDVKLNFRHTYWNAYYHYDFNRVYIRGSSSDSWILAHLFDSGNYAEVDNDYKLISVEVTQLLRSNGQEFSSDFQVRWVNAADAEFPDDGYSIDDIKLFKTTSDMELLTLDAPSFSLCDMNSSNIIKAVFRNNGTDDCFNVPVKMSFDGNITEHLLSVIKKGETASLDLYYPPGAYQEGKHILKLWCEKGADINLANDTLKVELLIPPVIQASSYLENFEAGNGGWFTGGTNVSWQFGTPNSPGVSKAASGRNAWKTNLTGSYNNNEESYLYSPCFYLDYYMNRPSLSFSAKMDMEPCEGNLCDMFYVEYNYGYGWTRLNVERSGTNWYNRDNTGNFGFWSGKVTSGWQAFTAELPWTGNVRFRFVFQSNAAGNGEGIAIDDIHIYSLNYDIYEEGSVTSRFSVGYWANDDWNHYMVDNKIVASIHPHGQNIEGIGAKTYLNEGQLLVSKKQLVLDRNFVLDAAESFARPVGVRLYVPESTIQRVITAADQPEIVKPESVYDLAVTKYAGPNQDGGLANNTKEGWDFFPGDKVTKVPYGNGYYLEFETKTFSEFWLARDYIGTGTPLPVDLVTFVAEKSAPGEAEVVRLKWSTSSEKDFSHFVVQVAVGVENVKKGLFYDLGTVTGQGMSGSRQYSYLDDHVPFRATRYYRLKVVDTDGTFTYSSIKSVAFDPVIEWRVFPNPSSGVIRLEPKGEVTGSVVIDVVDLNGKVRKTMRFQKAAAVLEVNLSSPDLADGLYVIKVTSNEGERQFKVVKE